MAAAPGITHRIPLPYGPLGAFLRDPLGFQLQARERFGDIFRFRIGPFAPDWSSSRPHRWAYGLMAPSG